MQWVIFTHKKKMLIAFILILLFTNLWAQFLEGFEGGEIPSTWKHMDTFLLNLQNNHAHSGIYVVFRNG